MLYDDGFVAAILHLQRMAAFEHAWARKQLDEEDERPDSVLVRVRIEMAIESQLRGASFSLAARELAFATTRG